MNYSKYSVDGVYFLFQNFNNLSKSRIRKPNNSRPINASHEPGVKGVKRAARPIRIKITPIAFLIFGLSWIYSLTIFSKFINYLGKIPQSFFDAFRQTDSIHFQA